MVELRHNRTLVYAEKERPALPEESLADPRAFSLRSWPNAKQILPGEKSAGRP
jgi:hypothetical protein